MSGIRELKNVHEGFVCYRAAGIPWVTKAVHTSMGDSAGLTELRQTVIRLRMAEAQPTDPHDKKHLLLRSGRSQMVLQMWSVR